MSEREYCSSVLVMVMNHSSIVVFAVCFCDDGYL